MTETVLSTLHATNKGTHVTTLLPILIQSDERLGYIKHKNIVLW